MKPSLPCFLTCLGLMASAALGCAGTDLMALPAPIGSAIHATGDDPPIFAREANALRIDQLQLKGSHNSYHRAPRFALSKSFRYTHLPLQAQLETQGVRHLELDVRYRDDALQVGHAPIIDGRTTCRSFGACIAAVQRWSKAHPNHVPVFIFIQPKEGLISAGLDHHVALIDREITRVFARGQLLVPRDVARDFPSLRDAVRSAGWPTLASTRGKVAFVLFGHKRLVSEYARGRPCLEGRTMFVATGSAGAPHAAILSIDDPVPHSAAITAAVRDHLLVRTRSDAGLAQNRRRRDAAIRSGAHFIGSDFVGPGQAWLDLGPDAPARQNPLTGDQAQSRRKVLEVERENWAHLSVR